MIGKKPIELKVWQLKARSCEELCMTIFPGFILLSILMFGLSRSASRFLSVPCLDTADNQYDDPCRVLKYALFGCMLCGSLLCPLLFLLKMANSLASGRQFGVIEQRGAKWDYGEGVGFKSDLNTENFTAERLISAINKQQLITNKISTLNDHVGRLKNKLTQDDVYDIIKIFPETAVAGAQKIIDERAGKIHQGKKVEGPAMLQKQLTRKYDPKKKAAPKKAPGHMQPGGPITPAGRNVPPKRKSQGGR